MIRGYKLPHSHIFTEQYSASEADEMKILHAKRYYRDGIIMVLNAARL